MHASVRALDDDGGGTCSSELGPLQPATDAPLDDHGFVVQEELQSNEHTHDIVTHTGGIETLPGRIPHGNKNRVNPIESFTSEPEGAMQNEQVATRPTGLQEVSGL